MSFSVPRCRSPICGSTRATTSPSSSSTKRSTPWAAGCCGPKLMVKLRRFCSFMDQTFGPAFPGREKIEFAEFLIETDGLVDHPLLLVVVAYLDEAGEREILAQRVAIE